MLRGFLVAIAFIFVVGCAIIMYMVGTVNQEVNLRVAITKQVEANQNSYDTMWKIIKQKAQIPEKYSEDFKKVYPDLMSARHQNGGLLAKFVTEANPNYDISLLKDLMASIEAERHAFQSRQDKLVDLSGQHEGLIHRFPSKLVLQVFGNTTPVEYTLISSGKTKDAFSTGMDEPDPVFSK
jgi:hypothetical protein